MLKGGNEKISRSEPGAGIHSPEYEPRQSMFRNALIKSSEGAKIVFLFKAHLKKVLPDSLLALRRRYLKRKLRSEFERCAGVKGIFTQIYDRGYWGQPEDLGERYFSGSGSHYAELVDPYIRAVTNALSSLGEKPDAVDLGCGDFAVGSRIRSYCGKYIACDVVEGLVARNRKKYENDDIEFRVVDIVNDELPDGGVVFIREVFQHLSNGDIEKVLPKLLKYRFAVVSEHLPLAAGFVRIWIRQPDPTSELKAIRKVEWS